MMKTGEAEAITYIGKNAKRNNSRFSLRGTNYHIGFSRHRGLESLSKKFAEAMRKYKKTQQFIELQKKYGLIY
ncbi:MAG: hypothetical protein GY714_11995 [Desulfobacterales bacterium]|nr:hypothetical protein [Desulfobacterales bacterium]